MKTVYVVVEVPDTMRVIDVEMIVGRAIRDRTGVTLGEPRRPIAFEEVGDLIDWAGVDVVEMARDAMRGGR